MGQSGGKEKENPAGIKKKNHTNAGVWARVGAWGLGGARVTWQFRKTGTRVINHNL